MLATIGYEKSSLHDFVDTLRSSNIEVLIDIRDRAQSRRPGFSKSALSEALEASGIEYLHLRALGDPKEGRDAARAGKVDEFNRIFQRVMEGQGATEALSVVRNIAETKRVCLMCYEADHQFCHRKIVSDHLESMMLSETIHLTVQRSEPGQTKKRRMLYPRQSASAPV